jgi:hypothetical protein
MEAKPWNHTPTQVHEGFRKDEINSLTSPDTLSETNLSLFFFKRDPRKRRHMVKKDLSCIMTGPLIVVSWVSQANHSQGHPSSS